MRIRTRPSYAASSKIQQAPARRVERITVGYSNGRRGRFSRSKRLVTDVAVVTRDSDMVPAFKLARREGLRVHLDHLGVGRCEQLCIHSDTVIG